MKPCSQGWAGWTAMIAVTLALWIGGARAMPAAESISVTQKGGVPCVDAAGLERDAEVAVKSLPGKKEWVACRHDRCVLLRDVREESGRLWVPVASLAAALGLEATWEEGGARVRLAEGAAPQTGRGTGGPGVGGLMPELALRGLNGETLSLGALRGKRVVINSWASW